MEEEEEEVKLPTVADLEIYDEFEAVTDTMNVLDAAKLMKSKDIGDLVVVTEEDVLSGVVMESDIIQMFRFYHKSGIFPACLKDFYDKYGLNELYVRDELTYDIFENEKELIK